MYHARNKAGKLLVQEDFGIHAAAEAECRGEDMHLFHFACRRVKEKLRLVAYPVNIHTLAGDAFHWHRDGCLSEVLGEERAVQRIELRELVSVRVFLLVLQPDKR